MKKAELIAEVERLQIVLANYEAINKGDINKMKIIVQQSNSAQTMLSRQNIKISEILVILNALRVFYPTKDGSDGEAESANELRMIDHLIKLLKFN